MKEMPTTAKGRNSDLDLVLERAREQELARERELVPEVARELVLDLEQVLLREREREREQVLVLDLDLDLDLEPEPELELELELELDRSSLSSLFFKSCENSVPENKKLKYLEQFLASSGITPMEGKNLIELACEFRAKDALDLIIKRFPEFAQDYTEEVIDTR